jgi:hypothetical protein
MAVTYNIKGTTNSSFKVGKQGTGTVYAGSVEANDLQATGNLTVTGNLVVSGTTTTVSSTTIDVKNSFRFEGATADAHETILTVEDPTADRTVTIPNATTTLVGTDTTQTLTNKTITDAASISIANTTTSDSLLLTTTEDSSTAGPVLTLKRNSASPDDADYLGQIKFKGENDADQETVYAKITGKILDATDGSEDGMLEYAFIKAGSQNISGRFRSDQFQLLNGTSLYVGAGGQISFEGSTSNAYETTIAVTDPTADRTITLPDSDGIVVTQDSTTGMMSLPVGTTVQRPGSPVTGSMRFNSTTKRFEGYNGIQWVAMSPYPDDITTPRDGDPVQLEPGDLGSLT